MKKVMSLAYRLLGVVCFLAFGAMLAEQFKLIKPFFNVSTEWPAKAIVSILFGICVLFMTINRWFFVDDVTEHHVLQVDQEEIDKELAELDKMPPPDEIKLPNYNIYPGHYWI